MPAGDGNFKGGNVPATYGAPSPTQGPGCSDTGSEAAVQGGAKKSGYDHIESGDLNPTSKDHSKSNLDPKTTSFLEAARKTIRESSRPETTHTWPCIGFVLRVEPKIKDSDRMANLIARKRTKSTYNTKSERYVRIKARIPEVHSLLPVPMSLPSRSTRSAEHKIIDLYPTFIAETTEIGEPKPGELVVLSFRNIAEFADGVYHGPLNENTSQILGSSKEPAAQPFGQGNAQQVGEGGGKNASIPGGLDSDCNGCNAPGGIEQCNDKGGSNLGYTAAKVAASLVGQAPGPKHDWKTVTRPYYGESSRKLSQTMSKYAAEGAGCDDCGPFISQIRNKPGWQAGPKPYKARRDYGAWCARFVNYCFIIAAEQMGAKKEDLPWDFDSGGAKTSLRLFTRGNGRKLDPLMDHFYPGDVIAWRHVRCKCDCPGPSWGSDSGECDECKEGGHIEIVEWFDPKSRKVGTICGNCGTGTANGEHWPAMVKRSVHDLKREMNNKCSMALGHEYAGIVRPFTA